MVSVCSTVERNTIRKIIGVLFTKCIIGRSSLVKVLAGIRQLRTKPLNRKSTVEVSDTTMMNSITTADSQKKYLNKHEYNFKKPSVQSVKQSVEK